jgi:Ser/Thr protein kinase RdoA (MazF antagonist)
LANIHQLQGWLAVQGLPVAAPVGALGLGCTLVRAAQSLWELAPWLPGVADYWTDPRPERLEAALRMLAELHVAAGQIPVGPMPAGDACRIAPALMKRSETLCNLVLTGGRKLRALLPSIRAGVEERLAEEALALIERTAPAELEKSARWENEPLPLQMCLRDVWHDHVLFTGDRVTGVIDFGAAAFDSPAGDVARLLGSLVGDDCQRWELGLHAYESIKPLSAVERDAIAYYDSSGVVLSAANWIRWLAEDRKALPPTVDRAAMVKRIHRLVERLKVLAESAPGH